MRPRESRFAYSADTPVEILVSAEEAAQSAMDRLKARGAVTASGAGDEPQGAADGPESPAEAPQGVEAKERPAVFRDWRRAGP